MVLIEALVCGTPVVALGRGSAPEILADGVTGFVCGDVTERPAAMGPPGQLTRGLRRPTP